MAKYQIEGYLPDFGEKVGKNLPFPVELDLEDGGHAVGFQLDDGKEDGMFVVLRSWSNGTNRIVGNYPLDKMVEKLREAHPQFNLFAGRHVRITVETLDEYK
jgi:hypothetical protein